MSFMTSMKKLAFFCLGAWLFAMITLPILVTQGVIINFAAIPLLNAALIEMSRLNIILILSSFATIIVFIAGVALLTMQRSIAVLRQNSKRAINHDQ
jgi:hypothetical protein